MERNQLAYSFDSHSYHCPSSQKQIQQSLHKNKHNSTSTHRCPYKGSQKNIQGVKKFPNYNKHTTFRKIKSKCETEAHQSIKKRNNDTLSISKKTLRKRKSPKVDQQLDNKLKISHSKNQEESLTLKSSEKRNCPKKELFHSTCFSRHLDQDLQLLEQVMHASSDFLPIQESKKKLEIDNLSLQGILERTKLALGVYQNRCLQLQRSCQYYKSQLQRANKKLSYMGKKSSEGTHQSRTKIKEHKSVKKQLKGQQNY